MNDNLEDKINQNREAIIRLEVRQEQGFRSNDVVHGALSDKLTLISSKLDGIQSDMDGHKVMLRTAGLMLLTLGSMIGWIIHEWEKLRGWFH